MNSIISDVEEGNKFNPILNKIENKIINAYEKILAINKYHFAPNVLYFLSNDHRINYGSLKQFFKGYINVFTENIDIRKHRDGNAYEAVRNIDLYVWYTDNDDVKYFFNRIEDRFLNRLQNIFKIDNFDSTIQL